MYLACEKSQLCSCCRSTVDRSLSCNWVVCLRIKRGMDDLAKFEVRKPVSFIIYRALEILISLFCSCRGAVTVHVWVLKKYI